MSYISCFTIRHGGSLWFLVKRSIYLLMSSCTIQPSSFFHVVHKDDCRCRRWWSNTSSICLLSMVKQNFHSRSILISISFWIQPKLLDQACWDEIYLIVNVDDGVDNFLTWFFNMHGFSVIFGPMDGIKSITFSLTINELGLESTNELTQARWDHRRQL